MTPQQVEFYRNACEARHVLTMPTKEERRGYLAGVEQRRGIEARKYLEKEIMKQWKGSNDAA